MLDTAITRIISEWNNARSGSEDSQAGLHYTPVARCPPPITSNMVDVSRTLSSMPHALHSLINITNPIAANSVISPGYIASSQHLGTYIRPQEIDIFDESLPDYPSYILNSTENAVLTKSPDMLFPSNSNWDQVFEEQQ